jgi:GRF zinc finger
MSQPSPPDPPPLLLPSSFITYYCGGNEIIVPSETSWIDCVVHGSTCPFRPGGNPAHRFERKTVPVTTVEKVCKIHQVPCKLLTVKKEGPNQGRHFFVCGNITDECDFFEWTKAPIMKETLVAENDDEQMVI